jgi:hypothetical protein
MTMCALLTCTNKEMQEATSEAQKEKEDGTLGARRISTQMQTQTQTQRKKVRDRP